MAANSTEDTVSLNETPGANRSNRVPPADTNLAGLGGGEEYLEPPPGVDSRPSSRSSGEPAKTSGSRPASKWRSAMSVILWPAAVPGPSGADLETFAGPGKGTEAEPGRCQTGGYVPPDGEERGGDCGSWAG